MRLILFEDLDRLDNSDRLFLKIRELNMLINESEAFKSQNRVVRFIYAISTCLMIFMLVGCVAMTIFLFIGNIAENHQKCPSMLRFLEPRLTAPTFCAGTTVPVCSVF